MKPELIVQGAAGEQRRDLELRKLKQACEDFESLLTAYVFKSMRETIAQDASSDEGQTMGLYEEMMDESVAGQLSRDPGLGLARVLYEQLVPLVEGEESSLKVEPSPADRKGEER